MAIVGDNQTRSEQIYTELRRDIVAQRIKSGEKLTLKSLKDRFQVSHTPIREALTRLDEDGLITYYSNVGVRVTQYTPKDVKDVFEFGCELDCIAMRACRNSFCWGLFLDELGSVCAAATECLASGRIDEWKIYSDEFHLLFYKYAENRYLDDAAAKLRAQMSVLTNMYQYNENVEKINAEHQAIYGALRCDQMEKAIALMHEHGQHDVVYAMKAL